MAFFVRYKLQVEERIKEKPLTRKETGGMVSLVQGLDAKNSVWLEAQKKRLSGDYYPAIISETNYKFSDVMYWAGHAFHKSEKILQGIISRNGNCNGFKAASHLSSVEIRGRNFSADIIAIPSPVSSHAFELHYVIEQFGRKVEDRREPMSEANLWKQIDDLGLALANYGFAHSKFF